MFFCAHGVLTFVSLFALINKYFQFSFTSHLKKKESHQKIKKKKKKSIKVKKAKVIINPYN